ncbi:MAG: hypothetical protein V1726_07375 [Methanobacteriota archaeon]
MYVSKRQLSCMLLMIFVISLFSCGSTAVLSESNTIEKVNEDFSSNTSSQNIHKSVSDQQNPANMSSPEKKSDKNDTSDEKTTDSNKAGDIQGDKSGIPDRKRRDAIIAALKKYARKIET